MRVYSIRDAKKPRYFGQEILAKERLEEKSIVAQRKVDLALQSEKERFCKGTDRQRIRIVEKWHGVKYRDHIKNVLEYMRRHKE